MTKYRSTMPTGGTNGVVLVRINYRSSKASGFNVLLP